MEKQADIEHFFHSNHKIRLKLQQQKLRSAATNAPNPPAFQQLK